MVSLENNYVYSENVASSTVIVSFFSTNYANQTLELHLTGVKDSYLSTSIISNIHLTIRCKSFKEISKSFYYQLQFSQRKYFRFITNKYCPNNQTDNISGLVGQQGIYNYSSSVFQPILLKLQSFIETKQLIIDGRYIRLN